MLRVMDARIQHYVTTMDGGPSSSRGHPSTSGQLSDPVNPPVPGGSDPLHADHGTSTNFAGSNGESFLAHNDSGFAASDLDYLFAQIFNTDYMVLDIQATSAEDSQEVTLA